MVLTALLGLVTPLLTLVALAPAARAEAPACTISAKLVNSCRPWIGAESGAYGATGFRASMLEHEARIGRQLDIVHEYLGTGAVLTNDIVSLANRSGTIALVNWLVSSRWANGDGRSAIVNTQIDNMARSIKALGGTKIMLTVHHEPENNISPGGDPNCPTTGFNGASGTVTDYVNMWHNVRARFDALGVTNVVWVMNYMGWKGWNCVVRDLWPGNEFVDWVMWDPYPKTATWTTFVSMFYDFLVANSDATHDFVSKPWGLAEYGYVGSSQAAAYAMYDEARRNLQNGVHPKLKAFVVWDQHTSNSHDDRVGFDENGVRDPVEQDHYNAFVNDPLLSGTATPVPVDQTAPVVTRSGPDDGATLAGSVTVTGQATDEVGVESVTLLVDGAENTTVPATAGGSVAIDWNTFTVPNGSHTLQLSARDAAGNIGLSDVVPVEVANVDEEPPTPPSQLLGTWSRPSRVTLTWPAGTDNGAVTGYRVYRDGDLVAELDAAARSHVDTGVANLATVSYTVTALDAAGHESTASTPAVVDTGDDTAPTAPTVDAELTGPDEVTVGWSGSTDNGTVAGYRVFRNGSLIRTVDAAVVSVVDGGLDDGVAYSYRVAAVDAAGNPSDLGGPSTVTTPDLTPPTAPGNLRAVSSSQSVALTWSAASDNVGVEDYVVYRDGVPLATPGGTTTAYTDTAPVGNTLHRYQVTARDAAGQESVRSAEAIRTLADTTAPTAPTQLTGSRSGFTVGLTWTAATDAVGVVRYTVYRGGVAVGTSTTTSYTDPAPPTGRSSSYTVRAADAAGNVGAASNSATVAVPADTTAPSAPSGLQASPGTRQVALRWNASTDNAGVDHYYLFRGNAKYRQLGKVTSYTDTGLTTGTRYTYKVYAIDATGNWSGPSANVSATAR